MLIASCSNDSLPLTFEKEVSGDYSFSLSLQTSDDVNTRALTEPGVDDLHENKVEKVELFFYNDDALIWKVPKSAFTMTDGTNTSQKKLIIRVPNDIIGLLNGQDVTLLAIANGPESSAMAGKTLTELKRVVFTSNDMNITRQYGFLMEGNKMTGNIVFDDVKPYDLGALTLQRSAAKLRLKINKLAVPEYEAGVATSRIVNYLDQTNLLKTDQVVYAPKSTDYVDLVEATDGKTTFLTTEIPYYSYENNWNADGSRETFILLRIPFTKDGLTQEYFYRIPINYRLGDGGSEVRRNHLYEISISITELGSTGFEMPIELISSVEVKPWITDYVILSELIDANYLVLKENDVDMAEVTETKIEYLSNSTVTVSPGSLMATFTGYNAAGTAIPGSPTTANMPKITFIEEGGKKYIKIVSPIPTNFVSLNIEFIVKNEGGIYEEVRIIQYPLKYVTAKKSAVGSTPIDGTAPGPTSNETNFNIFRITTVLGATTDIIGDPTGATGHTKGDEESNKIVSPQFLIGSQRGVTYERNYATAKSHCYNYYEDVYGPGKTVDGRWRLPTQAELKYINDLQKNPLSAVKKLFEGEKYWSAREYMYYNFTGTGSWSSSSNRHTAHIRCVFDVYKYE